MRASCQAHATVRDADEPAPTITGAKSGGISEWVREREQAPRDVDWPQTRPATTVAGDPRIPQPGHKADSGSLDSPGYMEGAIRVSIEEAAVLQGFPADYPWQGTRTARFRQIGDAVPPPLAEAILRSLLA
jgi:DNA (cytosine-5)-methyltransferase 1